jgi:fucose permease
MIVMVQRRSDLITIVVSYSSFLALGMSAALLNLAWAKIREEFSLPLDAVGWLLLASTLGYFIASSASSAIELRLGAGKMFLFGTGVIVIGLLSYVLTQSWLLMIICALITNLGAGMIDAGTNAYTAAHRSLRVMNWLHASFSVGLTISPLLMTALFNVHASWRWGYAFTCGIEILIALGFLLTMKLWYSRKPVAGAQTHTQHARFGETLRLPVVWLSVMTFALYTGLEAAPGQWSYDLFTHTRAIDPATAGLWVSLYWGAFTIGRVVFGFITPHVPPRMMLRLCMVGMFAGTVVLWWNPVNIVGLLGLAFAGFMQAPIFAVMTSNTVNLVGERHAHTTIGFQLAGAGLGFALVPGLAGILANNLGLAIIPSFLTFAAMLLIGLYEFTASRRRAILPEPQAVSAD